MTKTNYFSFAFQNSLTIMNRSRERSEIDIFSIIRFNLSQFSAKIDSTELSIPLWVVNRTTNAAFDVIENGLFDLNLCNYYVSNKSIFQAVICLVISNIETINILHAFYSFCI